ncbi:MAG: hypothetical protein Kow00107_06330 [Planctomycetota bacterium]
MESAKHLLTAISQDASHAEIDWEELQKTVRRHTKPVDVSEDSRNL